MKQMKKWIAISLAVVMLCAMLPISASAVTLTDIDGSWAKDVILYGVEKGYIGGFTDGTFRPNQSVTRAQFAKMLNNALGVLNSAPAQFTDVSAGAWYYDEESNGIYDGLLLVADYDTGEIYDRFTVPESWNIEPKSPDDETEEWQMYTFITSGPIAGSEKYDGGPLFFEERQNEAKTIFSEEDSAEINEAIRR